MDELSKLGLKYGTDKIGKHNYLPVYYELFADERKLIKSVLEIGVGEGAGLRMFRDFFPNAEIYGAEIDKNRLFREGRISVELFDQSCAKDIVDIMDIPHDIVIDDGSHRPDDQLFTCLGCMSLSDPDITYIIEDVSDPGIVKYLDKYDVKVVECGKRYDDRLIIVRHK